MPIDVSAELPQPATRGSALAAFVARRLLHGGGEELRGPGRLAILHSSVTLGVTVAAVLAGVVGAVVTWRVARDLGGARTTALALTAVAAVSAVSLVVLVAAGLRMFGVLHLGYLVLTVAVPCVGVALVLRSLATHSLARPWALVGLVLVLPAAVGWYATHVEPYRLRVDRVSLALPRERDGNDALRIGVLSDLQTNAVGDHEQAAVDLLMAEEPDVILVPGDLFQASDARFSANEAALRSLLGQLAAPGGVYLVRGDCDPGDRADRAVRGTDIVILDDEMVDVKLGDRTLRIAGNRLYYNTPTAIALRQSLVSEDPAAAPDSAPAEDPMDSTNTGLPESSPDSTNTAVPESSPGATDTAVPAIPASSADATDAAVPESSTDAKAPADDGIVRILLSHRPDAVLDLPASSNVDLTVAGHTHGGQVVIPGFGPLMTLTAVPRHVARGGLHDVSGNDIYVSNGVGLERNQAPQLRLFSPPSVGLIELR